MTGSSAGIGHAIAVGLARAGASVVVESRGTSGMSQTATGVIAPFRMKIRTAKKKPR